MCVFFATTLGVGASYTETYRDANLTTNSATLMTNLPHNYETEAQMHTKKKTNHRKNPADRALLKSMTAGGTADENYC